MSDSFSSSNLKPPTDAPKEPKKLRFSMPPPSYLQPSANPWTRNRASSPATQLHSSSPLVQSPLQKSFQPEMSKSEPSSPNSATTPGTPSRRSRLSEQVGRARGESRSSSVPLIIRTQEDAQEDDNEGSAQQSLQSSSRAGSRTTSPLPSPAGNQDGQDRRSVKHLTCFWFWTKGGCKYSAEDCLYAHYDTGHYTAAPRQVVPGEPAKAGKSLERALSKIALTNRSSAASLPSLSAANPTAGDSLSVGVAPLSRPGTPFSPRGRSRAGTPSPRSSVDFSYSAGLRSDNDFLRGIVEDTQREKRLLQEKVTSLENEKSQLTTEVDKIKEAFNAMLREREALQATIRMLQFPAGVNPGVNPYAQNGLGTAVRSSSTAALPAQNPWGAVGSTRGSGSSGPGTPIETPADSPPMQQRYFSYPSAGGRHPVSAVAPTRMNGTSALNPAAPAYGSAIRLSQNNANTSNANEEEELRHQNELLRHLGSGF